jgi:hypothetical protein
MERVMSKIGNFVLELQSQGALLPEENEPDFLSYAKDYMQTDEYAKEHNEHEQLMIDDFIASVKGHSL